MSAVEIAVPHCAACPFVMATEAADKAPWYCDAFGFEEDPRLLPEQRVVANRWPDPPEWCPLRTADRIVTLGAR